MSPKHEWEADIEINEKIVTVCLQEQFPSLLPLYSIELVGEGWDNKVFLINKRFIFRFPRRKIAIELIENENRVLEKLPSFNSVKIPRPIYKGQASSIYPYPFHGYEYIEGVSGYLAKLNEKDRIENIETITYFLKELHSIDEKKALDIGIQSQPFDRTEVTKATNTIDTRVNMIMEKNICTINKDVWLHELQTVRKISLPFHDKCLVHGDIDARHLIFHQKKLTGVIDWGDLGINNRAVDLSIIWSFYLSNCHGQFLKLYPKIDSVTWQYARFLGLYSSFTHILYGHDINDTELLSDSIQSIRRINSDLIIDN